MIKIEDCRAAQDSTTCACGPVCDYTPARPSYDQLDEMVTVLENDIGRLRRERNEARSVVSAIRGEVESAATTWRAAQEACEAMGDTSGALLADHYASALELVERMPTHE